MAKSNKGFDSICFRNMQIVCNLKSSIYVWTYRSNVGSDYIKINCNDKVCQFIGYGTYVCQHDKGKVVVEVNDSSMVTFKKTIHKKKEEQVTFDFNKMTADQKTKMFLKYSTKDYKSMLLMNNELKLSSHYICCDAVTVVNAYKEYLQKETS